MSKAILSTLEFIGGAKVTGLPAPVDASDAVTKAYADGLDGLPAGGTAGQVLTRASATDGDANWQTPSGGGGDTTGLRIAMRNNHFPF